VLRWERIVAAAREVICVVMLVRSALVSNLMADAIAAPSTAPMLSLGALYIAGGFDVTRSAAPIERLLKFSVALDRRIRPRGQTAFDRLMRLDSRSSVQQGR